MRERKFGKQIATGKEEKQKKINPNEKIDKMKSRGLLISTGISHERGKEINTKICDNNNLGKKIGRNGKEE